MARDPASGLLDDERYFYRNQDLWRRLDPKAARGEMEAQGDRALPTGLDLTHVDCHMFSMLAVSLIGYYVDLGFARRLPVLMTHQPPFAQHFLVGGDWGRETEVNSYRYRIEARYEGTSLDRHGFLLDISDIDERLDGLVPWPWLPGGARNPHVFQHRLRLLIPSLGLAPSGLALRFAPGGTARGSFAVPAVVLARLKHPPVPPPIQPHHRVEVYLS